MRINILYTCRSCPCLAIMYRFGKLIHHTYLKCKLRFMEEYYCQYLSINYVDLSDHYSYLLKKLSQLLAYHHVLQHGNATLPSTCQLRHNFLTRRHNVLTFQLKDLTSQHNQSASDCRNIPPYHTTHNADFVHVSLFGFSQLKYCRQTTCIHYYMYMRSCKKNLKIKIVCQN